MGNDGLGAYDGTNGRPLSSKPVNFSDLPISLPLTKNNVIAMMKEFNRLKVVRPEVVRTLVGDAKRIVSQQGSLIDIRCPVGGHLTVVGDIHGQYFDMIRIFRVGGWPSATNAYVFDGDFVDRGPHGCEVVLTLIAWKLVYPDSVFLLRGNHEVPSVNEYYGFKDELQFKYRNEGDQLRDTFNSLFTELPIGAVIADRILVVHGGIPRLVDDPKRQFTMDALRGVQRESEPMIESLLSDVLWSDPHDELGMARSERNAGVLFGPDVTQRFLSRTGLDCVIRAHQVCADGYRVQHHGRVLTVFSAPNYCGRCDNLAAVVKFDDSYRMRIFQFKETTRNVTAVDPPNAVAMQGVIGRYVSLTVGTDVEALHGHNDKGAAAVRWNPEGSLMVSGGDDGSVRIWDVHGVECAALQLDRRAYGAVPEVKAVEWLGDTNMIAIGASDGKLRIWEVNAALSNTQKQEELAAEIAKKTKEFDEFAHALLEQCHEADHEAQVKLDEQFVKRKEEFDEEKGTLEEQQAQVEKESKLPPAVVTLKAHSGDDPQGKRTTEAICSLAWSQNLQYLASASKDCSVRIWDIAAAKEAAIAGEVGEDEDEPGCLAILEGHKDWVWCVAWNHSQDTLASSSEDGSVRLWNVTEAVKAEETLRPLRSERRRCQEQKNDAGFTELDGRIKGEMGGAGILLGQFSAGGNIGMTAVAFNSGGMIATGSTDDVVRVWDENGSVLFSSSSIGAGSSVSGHGDTITALAWHSETVLVSGSNDKTLRVWNIERAIGLGPQYASIVSVRAKMSALPEMSEETKHWTTTLQDMEGEICPAMLMGLDKGVSDVACSPDGSLIAAASLDKNSPISLWPLECGPLP